MLTEASLPTLACMVIAANQFTDVGGEGCKALLQDDLLRPGVVLIGQTDGQFGDRHLRTGYGEDCITCE
jgi:hypothetical protein